MDLEPANDPSVLVLVILEVRHRLKDLDEFLPLVLLFVQLPDVLSGNLSVERHAQHGLNPAKPRTNGWNERDLQVRSRWKECGKVSSSFAFVDVVREGVRSQTTVKALSRHLRHGGRSAGEVIRSSYGTCTAVSGNAEHSRQGTRLEIFQEWGNEELCRSGVAPRVRDPLGLADRFSRVQLCQTGRKQLSCRQGNVVY